MEIPAGFALANLEGLLGETRHLLLGRFSKCLQELIRGHGASAPGKVNGSANRGDRETRVRIFTRKTWSNPGNVFLCFYTGVITLVLLCLQVISKHEGCVI